MRAGAVEAVTFDVGSTLLADPKREEHKQQSRALKHWLKDHGLVDKPVRRRALAEAARAWSDRDLESTEAAVKAAERIIDSLRLEVVESERERLQALLADVYEDGAYSAAEGARAVLRRLKNQGVALGIVSNRGARPGRLMMRQLDANGLADFFESEAVIWSDEVGISKPDPRIHLACLKVLGVEPQQAAHVGDVKAKDVAGARELGMTTVRYTGIRDDRTDGPEADIVISHYDQLEQALSLASPGKTKRRLQLLSSLSLAIGPAAYEAVESGSEVIETVARLVASIGIGL
jgi:putative hydrolase of the HAD superfamily